LHKYLWKRCWYRN